MALRTILDQFLGALLGAWVGVATEIWKEPPLTIIIFVGSLSAIALLLNMISSTMDKYLRIVAGAFLVLLFVTSGFGFNFLGILETLDQLWFYYSVLGCWLALGALSTVLESRLRGLTVNLTYQVQQRNP